jgi:hypothetical protein
MQKNIIIYGVIAGIVVSILMLSSVNYLSHCEGNVDYNTSMLIGYASMLLSFSLVFVGIRNYRDKYNGGVISFGKAFKTGNHDCFNRFHHLCPCLAGRLLFFIPDFMDKYAAHMLDELKASGASQEEIDKQIKDMESFAVMYKNPFFNANDDVRGNFTGRD